VLHEESSSLVVRCVGSVGRSGEAGKRLLVQRLVEECMSLFDALFARGPESTPRHLVSCPHCLAKSSMQEPARFPYDECVLHALGRAASFRCGNAIVPVSTLGSDLTFGYVSVMDPSEVKLDAAPFAAGGFGSIYRAHWHGSLIVAKVLAFLSVCFLSVCLFLPVCLYLFFLLPFLH
jgi:hypothetical protein